MVDIGEFISLIAEMHGLKDTDRARVFYYDETNNVRRLQLTDAGFNVADPACFVLGGVGHDGRCRPLGLDVLRPKLYLQANMDEIKLVYLGKGDFLSLLKSERIGTLLEWIEGEKLFIHYQVIDPLYWSLVDIIDSIAAGISLGFDMLELRVLKNALYALLREDQKGLSELMGRYDYPNVGGRRREFLDELLVIVGVHLDGIESEDAQTHYVYMMLKGVLQAGRRADVLPFLEDVASRVLIDEFGSFFANRITTFATSEHIFDNEHVVRIYLENLLGKEAISYRFVDSKDEDGVQLSDVIIGLLGKAFSYCTRTPIDEIERDLSRLTDRQARNLAALSRLLDQSTSVSNAFAQRILSDDDEVKAARLFASDRCA